MMDFFLANLANENLCWEEVMVDPLGGSGYKTRMVHITGDKFCEPSSASPVGPILMVHDLYWNVARWFKYFDDGVTKIPERLFNMGYDIWMADMRGTLPSQEHTTSDLINSEPETYWDFLLEDMGEEDIPAMLKKVLDSTTSSCKKVNILTAGYSSAIVASALDAFPSSTNNWVSQALMLEPIFVTGDRYSSALYGEDPTVSNPCLWVNSGRLLSQEKYRSLTRRLGAFITKDCRATWDSAEYSAYLDYV